MGIYQISSGGSRIFPRGVPLADLGGARPARAPHLPGILEKPISFNMHFLPGKQGLGARPICNKTAPPHLPGILVFDDILGHIV